MCLTFVKLYSHDLTIPPNRDLIKIKHYWIILSIRIYLPISNLVIRPVKRNTKCHIIHHNPNSNQLSAYLPKLHFRQKSVLSTFKGKVKICCFCNKCKVFYFESSILCKHSNLIGLFVHYFMIICCKDITEYPF